MDFDAAVPGTSFIIIVTGHGLTLSFADHINDVGVDTLANKVVPDGKCAAY